MHDYVVTMVAARRWEGKFFLLPFALYGGVIDVSSVQKLPSSLFASSLWSMASLEELVTTMFD